jgi:hypothetical protein
LLFAKFKRHESLSSDQIPAKLIQAGGEKLRSETHKHIHSICIKQEWSDKWKESIFYEFTKEAIKLTLVVIVEYHYS